MRTFDFGKIKEFREAAGLTIPGLAAKLTGVAARQVWEWEHRSNDRSLTSRHLAKLADALGRSTDDFFTK